MIVSASRRTDIPAFYAEWFMNRIRQGFVHTRNPFRPTQIGRVSLKPATVDAIVFWTRNAEPLVPHLDELNRMGYHYYFQYTLVHYPKVFEGSSVSLSQKIDRLRCLSQRVGSERIIWRYDPIILSNLTDQRYHESLFLEIARALRGFTHRCVISFLDIYRKVGKALEKLNREQGVSVIDIHQHENKAREISRLLSQVGRDCGLEILSCAEPFNLEEFGITHGKCIDDELLNRIFGLHLSSPKDKHQRALCKCVESKDIGAYDTCPHGCIYCYANSCQELAQSNFRRHDRQSPFLLSSEFEFPAGMSTAQNHRRT